MWSSRQVAVQFDVVFPVDRMCRAKTYENVSKSACAPTLAKPGNSWFETAGSRVVGISEWDRIVLEEVDDVAWPGGGHSCSWEVRQVVRQRGGMSQLNLVMKADDGAVSRQLSVDVRISTDVVRRTMQGL